MNDEINLDFSFEKFLAPAKLNLFLKIKDKKKDGYHNLQSVFQLISLYDEISIKVRNDNKINFKNSNPLISKEKDIAYKACILILDRISIGIDIDIKKNIPIGSGLGGGSSDAATILMAINKICQLGLSKEKLMQLGLELGADVPFFIFGENAWVEGIGDQLSPISIPEFDYVVAVPNISIPTSSIFGSFKLTNNTNPLKIASSFNSKEHGFVDNDLESLVINKFLIMSDVMDWMKSYGYAKMSGTGSSIFLRPKSNIQSQEMERLKPQNTEIYAVKGLSVHPFYLTD
jgi:4-diphosphocytidyl-2-C-methyl-D-erythritol kinase|tara:strand:+ start:3514 stop:4377 length:864 start_codon:yes stop_codon:yes gene_type:complete